MLTQAPQQVFGTSGKPLGNNVTKPSHSRTQLASGPVPPHHHENGHALSSDTNWNETEGGGFEGLGLSQVVMAAVAEMGYQSPTPVQEQAIPLVLEGRDVMAAAQTGTGKTAAFLLPALSRLGRARRGQGPLMLVVTPTRELAQQIEAVAQCVCAHSGQRVAVLVGGVSYEPQRRALKSGCDLLIATPGRLIDLVEQGDARLSDVELLVLDEADRMLDMGFLPAVRKIVAQAPRQRQTLLFSATLGEDVLEHTRSLVRNPARVDIAPKGSTAATIDQYVLATDPKDKNRLLAALLHQEGPQRVIVFCRGKHRADGICRRLRREGFGCAPIHGNRNQNQRERALQGFKNGEVDVLVATDVLARGIDVPEVSYVVNFDVPGEAEDYIHRIGRTGRAGERGWALSFVTEEDYLDLRDIEQLMGRMIPSFPRAGGLSAGKEGGLSFLDPHRDPFEALPNKKLRKKMAARRAAAKTRDEGAAAQGPSARSARSDSGRPTRKPQAPGSSAPAGTPSESGRPKAQGRRQRLESKIAGVGSEKARPNGRRKNERAKGDASSDGRSARMVYGPGNKPKPSLRRDGGRRPGDKGGRG